MALIVSARSRSDAPRYGRSSGGALYDEFREVIPAMSDMVLVQGPDHEEGQGFKMEREKAEQYVKDNPEAKIVGDVESPPPPGEPEQPANGGGEASKPEESTPASPAETVEPAGGSANQPSGEPEKPASSATKPAGK